VPRNRIHVIPNAIDAERLDVAQPGAVRCKFRNAVGLAPDELVGLFVGHNYWLKGLKPLLHALADRKRRRPGARPITLVVCGGGAVGPFRRMARNLGLGDSVRLLGFVDDVRACYWSCDFLVAPTYYDPCSLVVFEALACGLPVITTACNGAGELMTDGREGYVVTAPDATGELTAALDHMADDAERLRMSAHAAALGREQSMDRHVGRLVKVFEEAAAKSRRGPHRARLGAGTRKFIG
jgi:UDP-glucose:(heptosyl)LPS alpha-1,3-glucosyltransferase